MKKVRIGNHVVGEGEACFVIAEAGVNHNGDVNLAKKMVEIAKTAGCDAVKFQTWKTDEVVTRNVSKPKYQRISESQSQYDLLSKLELSDGAFRDLSEYAESRGIIFLSTPEGNACIDFINGLNVPAFKIGSADLTNRPHLEYIASKGKPVILSTGMATIEEVKEAVTIIENAGNKDIVLLHCTTEYPARLESINLRAMLTLKKEFDFPVGYSDHTKGIGVSIMATALGASMIEKHFTLDRLLPGVDHKASLEPKELIALVKGIRLAQRSPVPEASLERKLIEISREVSIEKETVSKVEIILGKPAKRPVNSEKEMLRLVRKYVVASKDIQKGEVLSKENLSIKRSGGGLEPKYLESLLGKTAKVCISKDDPITLDKVVS